MATYTWSRLAAAFRSITSAQPIARDNTISWIRKGCFTCSSPVRVCSTSSEPVEPVVSQKPEKIPTTPYLARNIKRKQALARRERRRNAALDRQSKFKINTLFEKEVQQDLPLSTMKNPYTPEDKKCILCKEKIVVNYKNPRLLSQFISPYTGKIYGRYLTGLCIPMQKEVARQIKTSRQAGFMPYLYRNIKYHKDPVVYNPFVKPRKSRR